MIEAEVFDRFAEQVRGKSLNMRYATEIIGTEPSQFDAIEIHGVRDLGDGTCEQDDDNSDFYSVYLHMVEGGITCVGDHSLLADARRYAREISARYHWPITYDL